MRETRLKQQLAKDERKDGKAAVQQRRKEVDIQRFLA
jgi:hypothetical protein